MLKVNGRGREGGRFSRGGASSLVSSERVDASDCFLFIFFRERERERKRRGKGTSL